MKFSVKNIWIILQQSFNDFIDNKVLKLSAALAFYTIFSLPAMLIIVISVSDIFYGRAAIEGTLYHQIAAFVGTDAALQIQQTIRGAALSQSSTGSIRRRSRPGEPTGDAICSGTSGDRWCRSRRQE